MEDNLAAYKEGKSTNDESREAEPSRANPSMIHFLLLLCVGGVSVPVPEQREAFVIASKYGNSPRRTAL